MYKRVEEPKENKNKAIANPVTQNKINANQDARFVDNRYETFTQRKIQTLADLSKISQYDTAMQLKNDTVVQRGLNETDQKKYREWYQFFQKNEYLEGLQYLQNAYNIKGKQYTLEIQDTDDSNASAGWRSIDTKQTVKRDYTNKYLSIKFRLPYLRNQFALGEEGFIRILHTFRHEYKHVEQYHQEVKENFKMKTDIMEFEAYASEILDDKQFSLPPLEGKRARIQAVKAMERFQNLSADEQKIYKERAKKIAKKTGLSFDDYAKEGADQGCCYITTTCVEYYGLPDDCEELTVLRRFRDEYLLQRNNGKELIELYYDYSPQIVNNIRSRNDEEEILKRLYKIIRHCVDAIKNGDNEFAYKTYCEMVIKLKDEFAPEIELEHDLVI